jgi:hypothetical protein
MPVASGKARLSIAFSRVARFRPSCYARAAEDTSLINRKSEARNSGHIMRARKWPRRPRYGKRRGQINPLELWVLQGSGSHRGEVHGQTILVRRVPWADMECGLAAPGSAARLNGRRPRRANRRSYFLSHEKTLFHLEQPARATDPAAVSGRCSMGYCSLGLERRNG